MNTLQKQYSEYIKAICESYNCLGAIQPIQNAFTLLMESSSGNSKRRIIRKIYNFTRPLTGHLYRDDNWANVYELFNGIQKAVPEFEFTYGAIDGGYSNPGEDGMPRRKTYTIEGKTPEGYPINGQLHCDAAGTMEDPFSAYDMTLILN